MIETLISLIIWLVVLGIIYYIVTILIGLLPLPEPIKSTVGTLIMLLFCVIILVALLNLLGVVSLPSMRLR